MRTKNKFKGICLFIMIAYLLMLNTAVVNSLGVSPARKTVNFEPNTSLEMEFKIINSDRSTFKANLMALRDIKDLIFFKEQTITIDSEEYRIPFKAVLRFPAQMEPGIHKGKIEINPMAPDTRGNMFAAYIAPQIPLFIRVPYPSKYADISLAVLSVDEGTPVPIYVEFDNLGSEDIQRAGAEIELYSPGGELITVLTTPEISVVANSFGKTQAKPSPIIRKGFYNALVKAYYDETSKEMHTNFTLGLPVVRIKKLITKDLAIDEVNKVLFRAYNDWNTELSVAGLIEINSKQSEMPVFRLEKDEEEEVTAFFDTTGLEAGEYNMSITLIYADQIKTETFLVKVLSRRIEILKKPFPIRLLILGVLIVIIIALVVILLVVKKRKSVRERNL